MEYKRKEIPAADWQIYGFAGGGAVANPIPGSVKPKTTFQHSTDKGSSAGRTVGAIIRDSVGVGAAVIEGEVEPNHDPTYERQPIKMRKEGTSVVNSIAFSFESSLPWPGPLVAFVVFDKDGKAVGRSALTQPVMVEGGWKMNVPEGQAIFRAIERSS